ncbi:heme-dependent oxidative N-demethylase family protein SCDLUD_000642 [Saccharomycodes ludwigii]|uniref:heme-dependent oxidative N-demethylase family protein n=1 Tax=Saccharomycodes ludwigii TaxID=36035 RepID=UPI001E8C543D|nr:hypothetical protein SCDLUD_000642 [Saccharomycodes ludwigii]KAH3903032.1 hypothetical protein SCDLUD_000642 [Saccharomycodes ludwigii]
MYESLLAFLKKETTLPIFFFLVYLLKRDLFDKLKANDDKVFPKEKLDNNADGVKNEICTFKDRWESSNCTTFNDIEKEQPEYDWSITKPYPYKPFKPGEYNLNMNVKTIPKNEWIVLESTYKTNILKKWDIIKDNYLHVIFFPDPETAKRQETVNLTNNDFAKAKDTVCRLYDHVVGFLINKFPHYFEVVLKDNGETPGVLYNKILGEYHPLNPWKFTSVDDYQNWSFLNYFCCEKDNYIVPYFVTTESVKYHLLILSVARLIEEDYILLFPNENRQYNNEYIFQAGVFAFAAGFDPMERFLKPISLVHGPVPEYKARLQKSMNKFFHVFQPGKVVMRVNFSFQTHPHFFVVSSNKGKPSEIIRPKTIEQLNSDGSDLFYRSERQCLIKLDANDSMYDGPICFTIKTYLFSIIKDLFQMDFYKEPQILNDLKSAVLDMQENVGQYKRKPEWGPALVSLIDEELTKKKQCLS